MIKVIIFSSFLVFGPRASASGCSSNFFQNGDLVKQTIIHDFGVLDISQAQKLIDKMTITHKKSLHYWTEKPQLNSLPLTIKVVTSEYRDLDTDCGWTKYGSTLFITHLEISTKQETFLYPDIFKNIYPEFTGINELIEIRP